MSPMSTVTLPAGIDLAVADEGSGPAVILVHGFPELAYSWRHQMPALAQAGMRAIAYDTRGCGASDKPTEVGAYGLAELVGDVIGLADTLGLDRFHLVGHDWGSIVAWTTAILHPDRIDRLVSLNVPYRGWCPSFPATAVMAAMGDRFSYVLGFQEVGVAEAHFEADPDAWLLRIYRAVSGDPGFPGPKDFAVFRDAYVSGGMFGPLGPYRNIDRNAAELGHLADAPITVPTLMITTDSDPILPARLAEGMDAWVANLTVEHVTGAGHWTQQEQPEQVNRLLVDFLG